LRACHWQWASRNPAARRSVPRHAALLHWHPVRASRGLSRWARLRPRTGPLGGAVGTVGDGETLDLPVPKRKYL
jgi:hypothetical protein